MNIEIMNYERHDRGERPWNLSVARILPDRRPRFCLQMLHGFSERKERWFPLMRFAASCGGVILMHDLRGHGASAPVGETADPEDAVASLGYDCGILMDDIDAVYRTFGDPWGEEIADPAEERLLPRFLFGHSMGALMAAMYAARRSFSIDGLILSGLPHRERMVSPALFGLDLMSFFTGDAACPKALNRRAFTRFNKFFAPEEGSDGSFLWLTNDLSVRQAFASDPLCNRLHPVADYKNLLRLVRDVWKPAEWDSPSDIPVLLMAGQNDPVAGGDEGVLEAERFFRDMGFSTVDARMYRDMRHEIFMDEGRQVPFADLCRFILTHLPGKQKPDEAESAPAAEPASDTAPAPDAPDGPADSAPDGESPEDDA